MVHGVVHVPAEPWRGRSSTRPDIRRILRHDALPTWIGLRLVVELGVAQIQFRVGRYIESSVGSAGAWLACTPRDGTFSIPRRPLALVHSAESEDPSHIRCRECRWSRTVSSARATEVISTSGLGFWYWDFTSPIVLAPRS